ncbi:glycoside hydrolase family 95 protein [Salegentibacter sp. BLCTC]|uniref:glycosyl hydrolase family 95 catalytic domain-containing protein n=1 Tax=Salegentibacter sp. BLCTC TaxID=2697368 RepID=UPI00187BBB13|nr:glycoside hydrolase N-terminal domain-containing protein [Salegentibacter sp. BLCTC]MBE7640058.1 glycoside hydrolase family 95 protein [Salegentibacter sp. BLCTC]
MIKKLLFLVFLIGLGCSAPSDRKKETEKDLNKHVLWYAQPASKWMEALPIGNGRLGAMIFGDTINERIQLNEDSLWPGGPDWGDSKGSPEDLDYIRQLILNGKTSKADNEIIERFSNKDIVKSHQTMGDLYLDFDHTGKVKDYRRSLSLNDALAEVSYTIDGEEYHRKIFATAADDAIIIQLSTTAQAGLNFNVNLDRPEDEGHKTVEVSNPGENQISMLGEITQMGAVKNSKPKPLDYGVKFETLLQAETDSGKIYSDASGLKIEGSKEVTLYLVANTSFYSEDFQEKNRLTIENLGQKTFEELLEAHKKDYQELFARVDFSLGEAVKDSIPTDKRLAAFKKGKEDRGLITDLFQYGRYLLISSSRPGTNPANLQGLWNQHIAAPWNADYHLNVNLQMNYWPTEVTNLSELHKPLFDYTKRLVKRGKNTAREQYGLEGAVLHNASDLWASPSMQARKAYWGSWVHGGGWLAQHFWQHYLFTQDKEFLKTTAYPVLKEFATFYSGWLVKDENTGKYVSFPETSPENSYINEEGERVALSHGSAMGHQIIAEVFDNTLKAAEILDIEDDILKEIENKRNNLTPGVKLGADGRILEWTKAYEEPEKGHRHLSHLYALHPGSEITEADSSLFEGAQKSINYRLEHGGAGTGWSRAWMINFNARLLDAKAAKENIHKFFEISLADNLFDLHPPFQIDGNFGYTAGIAEMLLQSHEGFLRILPALPDTWKKGGIKGLKARGNISVDISWELGRLKQLTLKANKKQQVKLKYEKKEILIELPGDNQEVILDAELNRT